MTSNFADLSSRFGMRRDARVGKPLVLGKSFYFYQFQSGFRLRLGSYRRGTASLPTLITHLSFKRVETRLNWNFEKKAGARGSENRGFSRVEYRPKIPGASLAPHASR